MSQTLHWFIEQLINFRQHIFIQGWMFDEQQEIKEIGVTIGKQYIPLQSQLHLPSLDVEQFYGKQGEKSRFTGFAVLDKPKQALELQLTVTLSNNKQIHIDDLLKNSALEVDAYLRLQHYFFQGLKKLPKAAQIVELGSRARSGVTRTNFIPKQANYIGFDILQGSNVDVVGDAHQLSQYFEPQSCDVIFSMSVFEHLIMPWKVALEMNKVLKIGGQVMITSHHAWALHETPWDFWRFSDQAWRALFNEYTGFEIVETALGEPASIVAHHTHPVVFGLENHPAYLASAVVAKKVADTQLSWDVPASEIAQDMYPQ